MRFTTDQFESLLALVTQATENPDNPVPYDPMHETFSPDSVAALELLLNDQIAELTQLQRDRDVITKLSQLFGRAASELDQKSSSQRRERSRTERELNRQRLLQAEQDFEKGLEPDLNNPELQKLYNILQSWEHFNQLDGYQEDDIIFMLDRWLRTKSQAFDYDNVFTRGIINANATGMGKTVESVAFLWVMRQVNPNCNIVWFTKTSLTRETAPECSNKWGFDMVPVTGTSPDKIALIGTLMRFPIPLTIAINYEAVNVKSVREKLLENRWDFVVIDEVHKLRGGANHTPTGIWTNTKNFLHAETATPDEKPFPLMLSGSIINNEVGELWAYLHIMDPERFPSIRNFRDAFESGFFTRDKLTKMLAPSMFRRRKDEVSIKMPERIIKPHELDMDWDSQIGRIYQQLTEDMWAQIGDDDATITLNNMLHLIHYQRALLMAPGRIKIKKKIVNDKTFQVEEVEEVHELDEPFKLDYIVELAVDLLLEGENVVIADAQYVASLDYIHDKLLEKIADKTCPSHVKLGKIYGKDAAQGGVISEKFRQNEINVILTNIQSGAEGFNWHQSKEWPGGAANMILCDDWWNPAKVDQLLDRVWRRGAENRVIVHAVRVRETVDYTMKAIREMKALNNEAITESTAFRAKDWKKILSETLRKRDAKPAT